MSSQLESVAVCKVNEVCWSLFDVVRNLIAKTMELEMLPVMGAK